MSRQAQQDGALLGAVPVGDELLDRDVRIQRPEESPAIPSPATTIGSRQFISAVKRAAAGIVAADVTSPPVPRSSASTRRTKSSRSKSAGKVMLIAQKISNFTSIAEALGALLLDEIGDVGARDEVDVDVLILVAAASPILRTPWARTRVKLSESMPGEA